MLIEFTVENYRSFKELTKLSMQSTKIVDLPEHSVNVDVGSNSLAINKLGVFFGSNAAGKSNMLRAFEHMRTLVVKLGIPKKERTDFLTSDYDPFRFSTDSRQAPTLFQSIYEVHGTYFRYGFIYDSKEIIEEWLYSGTFDDENKIFIRYSDKTIEYGDAAHISDIKNAEKYLNGKNLLLSVGADLKIAFCEKAISFFISIVLQFPHSMPLAILLEKQEFLPIVSSLLAFADTGISNIESRKRKSPELEIPEDVPDAVAKLFEAMKALVKEQEENMSAVMFRHSGLDGEDPELALLPEEQESRGTLTFITLLFRLCLAIQRDSVVVVDELDNGLHPLLVAGILKFFTSIPGSKAQLLCSSHCSVIFSREIVRRDELWITEKDIDGQSVLISASDYKDARSDGNLTRRYLEGRFGGVPLLDSKYFEEGRRATIQMLATRHLNQQEIPITTDMRNGPTSEVEHGS